jgi:antitoxin YefM
MKTVNYSELRKDLKTNLDIVTENDELLIIHRSKDRSIVMMSLNEYNSMQETLHLTKSKANRRRLEASVENINQKKDLSKHYLIED